MVELRTLDPVQEAFLEAVGYRQATQARKPDMKIIVRFLSPGLTEVYFLPVVRPVRSGKGLRKG